MLKKISRKIIAPAAAFLLWPPFFFFAHSASASCCLYNYETIDRIYTSCSSSLSGESDCENASNGTGVINKGVYEFDADKSCYGEHEAYTCAAASSQASARRSTNPFDTLEVAIPGMKKFTEAAPCASDQTKMCIPWISEYIVGIYNYAIAIAGIVTALVLMVAGAIWITAGGNASNIGEAKAWIASGLTGLVLIFASYTILREINPDLVGYLPIAITPLKGYPLEEVEKKFATAGCPTAEELKSGYTAFTTAYCKPQPKSGDVMGGYYASLDFLCRVGLNCTCPAGSDTSQGKICGRQNKWCPCKRFPVSQDYCDKTKSGTRPAFGQVAADMSCSGLGAGTMICINGQTYTITDTGGAIKGKRIDIFVENCDQAGAYTKQQTVKIGACP